MPGHVGGCFSVVSGCQVFVFDKHHDEAVIDLWRLITLDVGPRSDWLRARTASEVSRLNGQSPELRDYIENLGFWRLNSLRELRMVISKCCCFVDVLCAG